MDAGVGGLVSSSLSTEYLPSQPQTHHLVLQHGPNLQQSMLLARTGSYGGMDHWAARFTSISSRQAQGPDQWGAMSAIGVEGTATGDLSDRMLQVNGTRATSGGRWWMGLIQIAPWSGGEWEQSTRSDPGCALARRGCRLIKREKRNPFSIGHSLIIRHVC